MLNCRVMSRQASEPPASASSPCRAEGETLEKTLAKNGGSKSEQKTRHQRLLRRRPLFARFHLIQSQNQHLWKKESEHLSREI